MLFSMRDLQLTGQERAERKMYKRIRKHRERNTVKIDSDIECLKKMISEIGTDEEIMVVSNSIDSPSVIYAYLPEIQECYIGTWAVTPAGIAALESLGKSDVCRRATMLMDTTHSYKWIFQSGAYEVLSDKVHIRFCANHSKFIVCRMTDGRCLNFIGSMNLSNNPRWENCLINRSEDDFLFFRKFCLNVEAREVKYGKTENS